MKFIIVFILFTFLNGFSINAQIENILWQNCLGAEDGINWTHAVEKTDNGYLYGIYIVNDGPGISNFHGGADAWIVNSDYYGNIIWERCYGGSSGDGPHKIVRIDDSTYYLFNHASSIDGDVHNFQGKDFWMVKIKENGEILWEKSFGGSVNGEIAVDAILMPDKGALMMGRISSSGGDITDSYGDMDVWLCRIDSVGTILWQKTIGNFGKDNGVKIKLSSHNTILFVGGHEVTGGMIDCPDHGYYIGTDVWIVEMDIYGAFINQWCYGGKYYDLGWDVIEVNDSYVIFASTRSNDRDVSGFHGTPGGDVDDFWVFKIDFDGNLVWQRCLGGTNWEYPVYLTETEDERIIVIRSTNSHDGDVTGNHTTEWNESDIWVVKLSSDGQLLWEHCFGGLGTDRFWGLHSVLKKDDYNYVIGANSDHASGDVTCDLYPNDESANAWIFEIKDCNYYLPASPVIHSGPDTLCSADSINAIYRINPTAWAWDYEWIIVPEEAGTVLPDSLSVEVTWNPSFEGPVEIKARSYNDCGYSEWSEPHITQVYTCLGTGEYILNEYSLIIIPNPADDKVTISVKGKIRKMQMEISIMNILGSGVKQGFISEGEEATEMDVSELPSGIYFITIFNEGKIIASGKMIVSR